MVPANACEMHHPVHFDARTQRTRSQRWARRLCKSMTHVARRFLNKSDERRADGLEFAARKRRSPSRLPSFSNTYFSADVTHVRKRMRRR